MSDITATGRNDNTFPNSESESSSRRAHQSRNPFLQFLTVIQRLGVPVTPISWPKGLVPFATGGTSSIQETIMNREHNLAFKRISIIERSNKTKVFKIVTDEIFIMAQPALKKCQHIAELHGICWEVDERREVWPVLVFTKFKYESLSNFGSSLVGRAISIQTRMDMCKGLGKALIFMHHHKIIHGDIKPDNVLVSEDTQGMFTPKFSDFGYSTLYENDDQIIKVPRTWHWVAPEYERKRPGWTTSDAKSMDVFSFGMLCLWFLFETVLSNPSGCNSPHVRELLAPHCSKLKTRNKIKRIDTAILKGLKSAGQLVTFAEYMLEAEQGISHDEKHAWQSFFRCALHLQPEARKMSQTTLFASEDSGHEPEAGESEEDQFAARQKLLSIGWDLRLSLGALYDSDFRVRLHIAQCLEEEQDRAIRQREHEDYINHLKYQRAICNWIGFGMSRDTQNTFKLAHEANRTTDEIMTFIEVWAPNNFDYKSHVMDDLSQRGYFVTALGDTDFYHDIANFEDVESHLLRDLNALEAVTGKGSLWLRVCRQLSRFYIHFERWEAAYEITSAAIIVSERGFGRRHRETLVYLFNMVRISMGLGELDVAEMLQTILLKENAESLGPDHPEVISDMVLLARIHWRKGSLEVAEKLQREALDMRIQQLGEDHPDTLQVHGGLALTLADQRRLGEAKDIQLQLVERSEKILGSRHLDTLKSKNDLASTYFLEDQYEAARELYEEVNKAKEETLGIRHSSTLTTRENIASTHRAQGRLAEAEEIFQNAALDHLHVHPPGSIDALFNCVQIWQQLHGKIIQIEDKDELKKLVQEYMDNRPEYRARYQNECKIVQAILDPAAVLIPD